MNVALPLLLLTFGGLTLWLLTESQLKWYFKTACIGTFCIFTIVFWSTIDSFLGWPASENDMPEKVLVHWIVIKEPNKYTQSDGAIYVLLESAEEVQMSAVAKIFGYNKDKIEPRLYQLTYSRNLHEHLQKGLIEQLKKGQPVVGKLTKGQSMERALRLGKDKSKSKGDGSESHEQEWHFHELLPSEIHSKPEN